MWGLLRLSLPPWLAVPGFLVVSVVAVALVVAQARRDAADPARCGGLVALGNRCCGAGQVLRDGACAGRPSHCPAPLAVTELGCVATAERVLVGGLLRVGAGDWEAEGRITPHEAMIPPFELDSLEITEAAYAACVAADRCPDVPRSGEPGRPMAGITRGEAQVYCAFRGGRLPTEDEWTIAAGGPVGRRYPWGDTGAVCRRASWGLRDGPCGFHGAGPELAGAHPDGATPQRIHDLAGNVAEWVWVTGAAEQATGMVRGGSFASALATDLRTWNARRLPATTRSSEVGARCAYDPFGPSPERSRGSLVGPP